jgi:gamma-glutamyl-gamma-aminobutyrate hydrolase PuuD
MANAYSSDSVIEGIEWKEKSSKPFFLGVQWHPERLALDQPANSLTREIRNKFIEAVKQHSNENY